MSTTKLGPLDDPKVDAEVIEDPCSGGTARRGCRTWTACSRTWRPRRAWWPRCGRGGRPPRTGRRGAGGGPRGRPRPGLSAVERASAPGSGWTGRGSAARGCPGARVASAVSRPRISSAPQRGRLAAGEVEDPDRFHPWASSRTIVPPMPSSASSGWGAMTRASSIRGRSGGPFRSVIMGQSRRQEPLSQGSRPLEISPVGAFALGAVAWRP